MKIKSTKQIEQEIEVELPCFVKFGSHYTKVISENEMLDVDDYDFSRCIHYTRHGNPFSHDGWQFITEEEFAAAHLKVMEFLDQFNYRITEHL